MRRWLRNWSVAVGGAIVLLSLVVPLAAPLIAPYGPTAVSSQLLSPPTARFPLGTDDLGRDVLSRTLYAGRASFGVVLPAVLLASVVGVALGMLSGYLGGTFDLVLMRFFDILQAIPALLFALVLLAFLGPSFTNLVVALALINLSQFTALARTTTVVVKGQDFVTAAFALGANRARILARHVLPNILPQIVNQVALSASVSLLIEAALTFLGIGIQPPTPSWGSMLSSSQSYLTIAPWLVLAPGVAIMLVVFGFNLLGDGIRDVADPRARG